MIFKVPQPIGRTGSPVIRLNPNVASRIYGIVELSGLTPSQVIGQMLDFIGEDYEVR
nr:MAG TPA: Ribbon-helix-helix domain [Caudoviricetes sp.]